jgi:histidinol-phosphate aminotransferase
MPHLWKIKQPYNVSVAAATAARVSLAHADQLEQVGRRIVSERERLFGALQEIPWLVPYPSHANFILCRVITGDAARLKAELAREGILIRYFNKPGLQDHIRVSVGKPEHSDKLLSILREWKWDKE